MPPLERRLLLATIGVIVGMWVSPVVGEFQAPIDENELAAHLTAIRSQIQNTTIALERREELALEMAATLDRAAQSSRDSDVRRHRWAQAVDLLDGFLKENADPPRERQLRFQAAVFRWAQGRSWAETSLLDSQDGNAQREAIAAFDDAIERFRTIGGSGNNQTLADNVRFRLAEALADRASLEPGTTAAATATGHDPRETEALGLLNDPPTEPGLSGYWHLLKADLCRRLKKTAEAEKELKLAVSTAPAPPPREIVEVNVPLLLDLRRFGEAARSVESARIDKPSQALWMVRVRLAEMTGPAATSERARLESELFRWLRVLRESPSLERRQGLLDLARAAIVPDKGSPPDVWEILAEAQGAAGAAAKAGALLTRAADRAADLGQPAAAASYRLRAGGFLFQAGHYSDAETILARAAADPAAGPLRAKAGMLRCLALGRVASAGGSPPTATTDYVAALDTQIHDFPSDPATDEARWLRGQLAVAAGDRARAEALWSAIAVSSPRWLESRLALAALDRDELDRLLINPNRRELLDIFKKADRWLDDALNRARSDAAIAELLLARARLNLTPGAGVPETARDLCERAARLPNGPGLHYRARLYRLVAMVEIGRYVEAEREAQSHSSWRVPGEQAALIDAIRLLDQCAMAADSDLRQRRFGIVLKLIVEPIVLADDDKMPRDIQTELAMRFTRSLIFTGADHDARRSVAAWRGGPQTTDERLLRDLGNTYYQLEAYALDINVQRLRIKNNAAGSLPWLDARYALALAYFHTGKIKEAAQLIDSTSILHPELGGNALHDKFVHLRQRLGSEP